MTSPVQVFDGHGTCQQCNNTGYLFLHVTKEGTKFCTCDHGKKKEHEAEPGVSIHIKATRLEPSDAGPRYINKDISIRGYITQAEGDRIVHEEMQQHGEPPPIEKMKVWTEAGDMYAYEVVVDTFTYSELGDVDTIEARADDIWSVEEMDKPNG